MSMFTQKILDGYQLDSADGYSVSSLWLDVHSSPFWSISAVFSAGNPNGTLSIQCSNDNNSGEHARGLYGSSVFVPPVYGSGAAGQTYPISAGSPFGTPLDANTLPQFNVVVTTTGVTTLTTSTAAYRWVRLVYTSSVNENTTIDAWMHRKSQIGRDL